jgi:hypothetical protein
VTCQQDLLVAAVAKAQPKTIVSVVSPGAVLLPFVNDVAAILASFMPGQSYGGAIRDVLYGVVNPSGKLPVTFPNHDNETQFSTAQWPGLPGPPPPPGAGGQQQITEANYTERLLVGYRYYDAKGIKLTTGFPFGFGAHCTSIFMARHSRTFLEKSSTHGCNLFSELPPSFDSFEYSRHAYPVGLRPVASARLVVHHVQVFKYQGLINIDLRNRAKHRKSDRERSSPDVSWFPVRVG